jgi:hypothetical protein
VAPVHLHPDHHRQEAVCIRAFLTQQKPDKFYLHSNLVDLSHFGEYWDQLYKGELWPRMYLCVKTVQPFLRARAGAGGEAAGGDVERPI